jgi:hypothetical protein
MSRRPAPRTKPPDVPSGRAQRGDHRFADIPPSRIAGAHRPCARLRGYRFGEKRKIVVSRPRSAVPIGR